MWGWEGQSSQIWFDEWFPDTGSVSGAGRERPKETIEDDVLWLIINLALLVPTPPHDHRRSIPQY
jgi:hypothetical protein